MTRRWPILALLAPLLTGCATARVVRLDTGEGSPRVVTPPRTGAPKPVELPRGDFERAVQSLAEGVRPSTYPLREARRLFWAPARHNAYSEVRGHLGLVAMGPGQGVPGAHLTPEPPSAALEQTRGYAQWCEQKSSPADCLHLLEGAPTLGEDGKYALAMAIAMDSVWDSSKVALGKMADPVAIEASIVTGMAMYLMLWVLPEPVSKGIAATLTACLIAYLGVSTTWDLIAGWVQLVREVDRATTFDEIRWAGERYGGVLGGNAARVLVMLVTAALGEGAGLAAKAPGLPGAAQASMVAGAEAGVLYGAVGEVQAIARTSIGFTITLTPSAVAMSTTGNGGGAKPRPTGYHAWKSFSGFKKAMGSPGPGTQWHHIVEQTPGNVARFGEEALHNTENVIELDADLHTDVSAFYSSIQEDITGSMLTIRRWLSTQPYRTQREFGLRAIENVRRRIWGVRRK